MRILQVLLNLGQSLTLCFLTFNLLASEALLYSELEVKLRKSRVAALVTEETIRLLIVDVATESALEGVLTARVANSVLTLDLLPASGASHLLLAHKGTRFIPRDS